LQIAQHARVAARSHRRRDAADGIRMLAARADHDGPVAASHFV
jgi:hypothetical protein